MIMYAVYSTQLRQYISTTGTWTSFLDKAMLYRTSRTPLNIAGLEYVPVRVTRVVELIYEENSRVD